VSVVVALFPEIVEPVDPETKTPYSRAPDSVLPLTVKLDGPF